MELFNSITAWSHALRGEGSAGLWRCEAAVGRSGELPGLGRKDEVVGTRKRGAKLFFYRLVRGPREHLRAARGGRRVSGGESG